MWSWRPRGGGSTLAFVETKQEIRAVLAGVSIQYYTRLERGDMSGASEGVLEALARALQLDDAERAHLFDLARAAQPVGARPRRRQPKPRIRPEIQWTLDAITGATARRGRFNHPVVGELTYAAEPGSRSAEALALLGSWAATSDRAESAADTA